MQVKRTNFTILDFNYKMVLIDDSLLNCLVDVATYYSQLGQGDVS